MLVFKQLFTFLKACCSFEKSQFITRTEMMKHSQGCVYKMSVDQMSAGQMSVGQISVDQMSVGQISVGKCLLAKCLLTKCLLAKFLLAKCPWPNVCWANVCWANVCWPNVCWPNGFRLKDSEPSIKRVEQAYVLRLPWFCKKKKKKWKFRSGNFLQPHFSNKSIGGALKSSNNVRK